MGRSGVLARGDLMVRRSRADAQGATAAPGEVVSSRAELARSLWGRAWPGQRCQGGRGD